MLHDGHDESWWSEDVVPTPERLGADPDVRGRGVTIAFLDSGFVAHPDLTDPRPRIRGVHDASGAGEPVSAADRPRPSDWHGTQTSVVAAGSGFLSNGRYRGIASESDVVLVKVGRGGPIADADIARGLEWILDQGEELGVRIVSISVGGDFELPLEASEVDRLAEEAVRQGFVVVVAAGNSGCADRHGSHAPATAPSVVTVGGYEESADPSLGGLALYCSSYGLTRDGIAKPEIIALARGVAAPILPGTSEYARAEELSRLAASSDPGVRASAREEIVMRKIVATHYQHSEGTSFAAPIVSSVVAQMLEVNPELSPAAVKRLLIETAERVEVDGDAARLRQGYGILRPAGAVEAARREKHGRERLAFGPPRREGGRLVFVYHDDSAHRVCVSGEFNGWNPAQGVFQRGENGVWWCEIDAPPPGRYRYKFLVDDTRWIEDPSHGLKEPNPYGSLDSVLVVEG